MIGGRKGWIAWPVGVLCVGVVAGLVWLAIPGVPGAIELIGGLLRSGSQQHGQDAATPSPTVSAGAVEDCRSLYPDELWATLRWAPDAVLSQNREQVQTAATAVRDALQPEVVTTCVWRQEDGTRVTTTLARVDASAAAIAQGGFAAAGFDCSTAGPGIRCTRTDGDTTEDDVVREGLWLTTVEAGWHPPGYTDKVVRHLWPE